MAGGKTYQVTQVDPLNPHTKGMVYQVNIVGGGTQMEELPEASADNVGQVYQYLGETGSGLTHGFFYESQALGTTPETYGWVAVNVQQGGATNSATTDLSNLTATGANIANWSSNISNCIVEIPQDIKLELNNGTLTLKSGSILTCPDSTQITTTIDYTRPISSSKAFVVVLLNKYDNSISQIYEIDNGRTCSGTTDTLSGTPRHLWYDTTENKIKYIGNDGTTNSYYAVFPIGLASGDGSSVSSIDQVFNGFGYIGKTIFGLPGVKALIPNGINSDGTLKSIARELDKVYTADMPGDYSERQLVISNFTAKVGTQTAQAYYDEKSNKTIVDPSTLQTSPIVLIGHIQTQAGVITRFDIRTPFHVGGYSNTEYIAHQAKPSGRYMNLTVPASGGSVIAPADGYIYLVRTATGSGQYVRLYNLNNNYDKNLYATGAVALRIVAEVSKGNTINVNYSTEGTTDRFGFIYANGAK